MLQKLNLGDYTPGATVDFYTSNKPKTLFAGKFDDVLIICDPNLVYSFSQQTPSDTEQRFINCFPDTEIAAICVDETSGAYGFAVIKDGVRQRVQFAEDQDFTINHGELLPEEISIKEEVFLRKKKSRK